MVTNANSSPPSEIVAQAEQTTKATPIAVEVRKAVKADVPTLAGVLARAFNDDPFFSWFVRADAKRGERFKRTFEIALTRMSAGLNETYTTNEIQGGALWKRPGEYRLGMLEQLALIPAFASITGWSGLKRFIEAQTVAEKRHEHHVPEPHYYLFVLGVEPALQGRSIGGQLIRPVLDICDREQLPAYLETALEINVRFYRKHGFEVVEEIVPVPTAPNIWLMKRWPARAQTPAA
jgi:ribosomal protein S18 acetylase RimI-like enzyme